MGGPQDIHRCEDATQALLVSNALALVQRTFPAHAFSNGWRTEDVQSHLTSLLTAFAAVAAAAPGDDTLLATRNDKCHHAGGVAAGVAASTLAGAHAQFNEQTRDVEARRQYAQWEARLAASFAGVRWVADAVADCARWWCEWRDGVVASRPGQQLRLGSPWARLVAKDHERPFGDVCSASGSGVFDPDVVGALTAAWVANHDALAAVESAQRRAAAARLRQLRARRVGRGRSGGAGGPRDDGRAPVVARLHSAEVSRRCMVHASACHALARLLGALSMMVEPVRWWQQVAIQLSALPGTTIRQFAKVSACVAAAVCACVAAVCVLLCPGSAVDADVTCAMPCCRGCRRWWTSARWRARSRWLHQLCWWQRTRRQCFSRGCNTTPWQRNVQQHAVTTMAATTTVVWTTRFATTPTPAASL